MYALRGAWFESMIFWSWRKPLVPEQAASMMETTAHLNLWGVHAQVIKRFVMTPYIGCHFVQCALFSSRALSCVKRRDTVVAWLTYLCCPYCCFIKRDFEDFISQFISISTKIMRPSLCDVMHAVVVDMSVFTFRVALLWINTLRQNIRHFPDDIFKWIFLNENVARRGSGVSATGSTARPTLKAARPHTVPSVHPTAASLIIS